MSPGCATRLTCADGTRAFVKAVGSELNPDTPGLFRREVAVLGHLGEHPLWASLRASYDDGAWVALLIEDVEGRHPDFTDPDELAAVLTGTDRLSEVLQERKVPESVDLADVGERFRIWADTLTSLADAPAATPVPDWLRTDPHGWADVLREHAARPMLHLTHWDIRIDNLLRRPGARSSSSTGEWRPAVRRGPTRCSPGWNGWASRGSTTRSPPPPPWPRQGTRPSPRSSPAWGPTWPSAPGWLSTSTCRRSTISGSGSRGACWRPSLVAPAA